VEVDGQQVVGVHAEEGFEHLGVAGGAHGDVGQARVLPPVARAPAPVVGVAPLAVGGHGEGGAVELDRIAPAPGAGGDVALQGVGAADGGGVVGGVEGGGGDRLAVEVEREATGGGVGGGGDMGPLALGQDVVGAEDGGADDEAEAVGGVGVEEPPVAGAGGGLVGDAPAAGGQGAWVDPGLDGQAGVEGPCVGVFEGGSGQARAGVERSGGGVGVVGGGGWGGGVIAACRRPSLALGRRRRAGDDGHTPDLADERVGAVLIDADADGEIVCRHDGGRAVVGRGELDPAAAPELVPPLGVRLPGGGGAHGLVGVDLRSDAVEPLRGGRRVLGADIDVEGVARHGRGSEVGRVESRREARGDHGAEDTVEQGIGAALEGLLEPLDLDEFVVHGWLGGGAVPADGGVGAGVVEQHIGVDEHLTAQAVGLGAVLEGVAGVGAGDGLARGAPGLDRGGRGAVGSALDVDPDRGAVGVDPEAQLARAVARAGPDDHRPVGEIEALLEGGGGERRVEGDADLADLEQAPVLVPAVGLTDVEAEVAGGLDPGVEGDVAVAEGHGAVGVGAGGGPDDIVAVRGGVGGLGAGRGEGEGEGGEGGDGGEKRAHGVGSGVGGVGQGSVAIDSIQAA
jgi:hypothetical protein